MKISKMHERWSKDSKYARVYGALEDEFVLANVLIGARSRAGLSQQQLARRMGTTQSSIARMESGRQPPSMRTLERLAKAVRSRLVVDFVPIVVGSKQEPSRVAKYLRTFGKDDRR